MSLFLKLRLKFVVEEVGTRNRRAGGQGGITGLDPVRVLTNVTSYVFQSKLLSRY